MTGGLPGRRVVLGVAGGIAAYKACAVLRGLTEAGHDVHVVPTAAALKFVGAATWEALSGHPVAADVWSGVPDVPHVRLGRRADLVVVVPATADLLARAATGLADDLLTTTLLTATCPVVYVPAMHTEMWQHPATRANVATLRSRGATVVEPADGRLTGTDSGPGRLPEPDEILGVLAGFLAAGAGPGTSPRDLAGLRVVVTAGGTREPLDPVRYLGNRSSGRMGVALARRALARGAEVRLVAAAVEVPVPEGVACTRVETALQLRDAVHAQAVEADVVVMAAAVADFRPREAATHKIKKTPDEDDAPAVVLVRNPDVLAELVAARRPGQVLVGFAAETGDGAATALEHARAKLDRKGCDLLVANDVSGGKVFGSERSEVVVLARDGWSRTVPETGKEQVADAVWDAVLRYRDSTWNGSPGPGAAWVQ